MYTRFLSLFIFSLLLATPAIAQYTQYQQGQFKLGMIEDCGSVGLNDTDWPTIHISELPQNQAMCIRFNITIDATALPDNTALAVHMLGARTVYFDGQRLAADGAPSVQRTTEQPGPIDSYILLPKELLNSGQHLIALQISNHHIGEPITRWFYTVALVDFAKVVKKPLVSIIPALLFVGALLMMFVFFQLVFWRYNKHAAYQIFSLLCFSSAMLLVAEHYRLIVGYSYSWHLVRLHWITALTFTSMVLLGLFYLLFYRFRRPLYWLLGLIAGLLIATLFDPRYDAKSLLMFGYTLIFCLAVNLTGVKAKAPGAKVASIMFALLLISAFISPLPLIFSFIEQWFAFIYFVIILSILNTLIGEMRDNRAKALSSARLESELLRRNLQPHFLMNSLMLIIEWIEHQPKAAVNFVQALSEELRILVLFSQKSAIPLDEEIQLCQKHLEVMSHRYMSHYTLQVEGSPDGITIPPAIIHTQIENAFSHNQITKDAAFTLQIEKNSKTVTLTLRSPLQKKANKPAGTGTGEQYIHARLKECFANRYQYSSDAQQGFWLGRIRFNLD